MAQDYSHKLSWKKKLSSQDLSESLADALKKREQVETDYRSENQRFWTIMFLDVTASAKKLWDLGERVVETVFALYQERARAVLEFKGACFIEPGGGPQVVCCFEDPADAILAADAVIKAMTYWNRDQDEMLRIMPAVGAHQGYVHYYDDIIHQSNTNNMAKRVQTEAQPGQVFLSSHLYETLKADKRFAITFTHTANLKNIPEPQDIYHAKVIIVQDKGVDYLSLESKTINDQKKEAQEQPETGGKTVHRWSFVFIDVCESTKKFWKYGDREARQLIKDYQDLCNNTFKQSGCAYVTASEGDQIIAGFEFDMTEKAVIASVNILQGLFRRNVNLPQSKQVRAAVGVHLGEVIFQGDELVLTKDMKVGKMIQGEAGADDLLVSGQIRDRISSNLQNHLTFFDTCNLGGSEESYEMYSLKWFNLRPESQRPTLGRPGISPNRFSSR